MVQTAIYTINENVNFGQQWLSHNPDSVDRLPSLYRNLIINRKLLFNESIKEDESL